MIRLNHLQKSGALMTYSNLNSLWLLLLCLLPANVVSADENKPVAEEDAALGRAVDFDKDVRPILQANCVACHNVTTNEGGVILESLDATKTKLVASAQHRISVLHEISIYTTTAEGTVPLEDVLKKEMSLAGMQIPFDPAMIPDAKQFFRMGEFAGWVIET